MNVVPHSPDSAVVHMVQKERQMQQQSLGVGDSSLQDAASQVSPSVSLVVVTIRDTSSLCHTL